jgi:high affinity choline transporter 7
MSVDTSTASFETTWGEKAEASVVEGAWYERVNWFGVGGILVMYVIMVTFGLWASRKKGQNVEAGGNEMEANMVAGRNIGVIVGCFTMTATWVGGGYINATAEKVFSKGLIWCQAPFGYALSLFFGGIFFAKKFRQREYITMLDPFQNKFGAKMGGFIFIPCVLGELMWCASILSALGSALSVILGISVELGVIVSTVTAVAYTLVGGLFAVAYVDIIQLVTVGLGLIISVPFAYKSTHRFGGLYDKIPSNMPNIFRDDGEDYTDGNHTFSDLWIGNLRNYQVGSYIDVYILLICGGIPWQVSLIT